MGEREYRAAERRLWASVGATPRERRLHLARNGVTVRVQEVGDGDPVLFLHGASNGGTSWATLVPRLDGLRCLLVDRPGCGLSDPLTRVLDRDGLRELAETLVVDVLDALGLATAHLVATSYGGLPALRAAAAHPGRVGRIVHFGWPVGAPAARLPWFMRISGVPGATRAMTALPPNERAVRAMLRRIGLRRAVDTGTFPPEALDWYVALLRHTDTMRNDARVTRALSLRGSLNDLVLSARVLADVRSPVFFLWGEEDPFGDADVARQLVEHLPHAELELLPRAGHAVWMDQPDHAAQAVTRNLRA